MKDVTVFTTVESLQNELKELRTSTEIAFVPTMGALHEGHLDLVRKAKELANTVVVSIFVNPTQFNSISDLENYPRTFEKDMELLSSIGNVLVFAPTVSEMYPSDFKEIEIELNELANVMEGEFRPGHFQGVVNVVHRFFEIVNPKFALFGEKDFQQLAIIQRMVEFLQLDVIIIPCATVREANGLARSSRNQRLSESQLKQALIIVETLEFAKSNVTSFTPTELVNQAKEYFNRGSLELEYLQIVDAKNLLPALNWESSSRMCIAAYCGDVRLIDNMELT